MREKKRLGEMLLESKLLTEEQLKETLTEESTSCLMLGPLQKARVEYSTTCMKLGQLLVHSGIVTENQIVDLLSQQLHIEKYHPDKYPVDKGLAKLIPLDIARKYLFFPARRRMTPSSVIVVSIPSQLKASKLISRSKKRTSFIRRLFRKLASFFGSRPGTLSLPWTKRKNSRR